MCSKTSSSSYGDKKDSSRSYLKKQKKPRVPRRGPGVAELERVLREQEKKCSYTSDPSCSDHLSFVSCPNSLDSPPGQRFFPSPPPPRPPTLPRPLSSMAVAYNARHVMPIRSYDNGNVNVNVVSETDGRYLNPLCSSPFHPCSLNRPNQVELILQPPMLQRPQFQKMNLLPQIATQPLSLVSSMGLCHNIEPSSSQRSYHNPTSHQPEEDKILGAKRGWDLTVTNTSNSMLHDRSNSGLNYKISRNATSTSSLELELELRNSVPNYELTLGSITFGSSSATQLPIQRCSRECSDFKLRPLHFNKEAHEHAEEHASCRSGREMSVQKKPFYSFLSSVEHQSETERMLISDGERGEANGDHGIDLSLKL